MLLYLDHVLPYHLPVSLCCKNTNLVSPLGTQSWETEAEVGAGLLIQQLFLKGRYQETVQTVESGYLETNATLIERAAQEDR